MPPLLPFDPDSRDLDFGHSQAEKAKYYPHHCGHHGCGNGNKKRCMSKGHIETCEVCHEWYRTEDGRCSSGHHHNDGYNIRAWVNVASKSGHEQRSVREVWIDVAREKGKDAGNDLSWEEKLREHVLKARDAFFGGTRAAFVKREEQKAKGGPSKTASLLMKMERNANVSSRPAHHIPGYMAAGKLKQQSRKIFSIQQQAMFGRQEPSPNQKARIWNPAKKVDGAPVTLQPIPPRKEIASRPPDSNARNSPQE